MPSMASVVILTVFLSVLNFVTARPGYVLTFPRFLQSGAEQKFCMTFHDIAEDVEVNLLFLNKDKVTLANYGSIFDGGKDKCLTLSVKEDTAKLVVSGHADNMNYTFTDETDVRLVTSMSKWITLIQTDKFSYKPGQTVMFRILTVDANLRPLIQPVKKIQISDPKENRIMQWTNVVTEDGLVSLEMPMTPDPTLGVWKITAEINGKTTYQNFEVKEYVLPKFEVIVKPPSYLLLDSEQVEFDICAKYTYGKPVKGRVTAEVCTTTSSAYLPMYRPCALVLSKIDGCQSFIVNMSTLYLQSGAYRVWNLKLKVVASVREEATGIELSKTSLGPEILREHFKLEFINCETYFKPGLPYVGKVRVMFPDDTPSSNQTVEVSAVDYVRDIRYSKNFTSDENGLVSFMIPPYPDNTTRFTIEARAPLEEREVDSDVYDMMYTPQVSLAVRKWFSPSGSVMQIMPIPPDVACGTELAVNIACANVTPGIDYHFYYQVVSRGDIISSGQLSRQFELYTFDGTSGHADYLDLVTEAPATQPIPPPVYEPLGHKVPEYGYVDREIVIPVRENPMTKKDESDEGMEHVDKTEEDEEEDHEDEDGDDDDSELKEVVEEAIVPEHYEPLESRRKRNAENYVRMFELPISITSAMSPSARLLVYYVKDDGEMVAASTEFSVERCFDNKVSMSFDDLQQRPGQPASLRLAAAPGSLCGVGFVDKSVHILSKNNQITPDKVFDEINKFEDTEYYSTYEEDEAYCDLWRKEHGLEEEENEYPYWLTSLPGPPGSSGPIFRRSAPRTRRSYYGYGTPSKMVDAIQAFRDAKLAVLSDMDVQTRPCTRSSHWRSYYGGIPGPGGTQVLMSVGIQKPYAVPETSAKQASRPPTATVRSYFPETWLWDLERVGELGEKQLNPTLPHTITEWVGSALCISTMAGLGVSPTTTIRSFQPFFVSITLPYSGVRGERIPVPVTVFNYLQDCLMVNVILGESTAYDTPVVFSQDVCVCPDAAVTHKFYIVPKDIGKINITVAAKSITGEQTLCSNRVMSSEGIGVKDVLIRSILIAAEGVEQEYTFSSFVCPEKGQRVEDLIELPLPPNMVADSASGYLSVIGDLLGPALSDLDKLLALPTGCGEQNMVKFAPNIFIMQYLSNTNQLTEDIQKEAVEFSRIGYQRELTYMHEDGSFSAFGASDDSGSMWLTAFVVKSFGQARPFIFIDDDQMTRSVNWFVRHQRDWGCFPSVGRVLSDYMKGGLAEGHLGTGLTAYVLVAMLESGVLEYNNTAITKAFECLNVPIIKDTYTLALVTYAYTMYDVSNPTRATFMEELSNRAISEDGFMYWTRDNLPLKTASDSTAGFSPHYRSPSAEVEITAYALMSLILGDQQGALVRGLPIVQWLSRQRNSYGGFSSTQDTVIALQSLAQYAMLAYRDGMNLELDITGDDLKKKFMVTSDNSILLQRATIHTLPNELRINAQGEGCVLVQAKVVYNVDNLDPEMPQFDLKVRALRAVAHINNCARRTIEICAEYIGTKGVSNMAVLEIKMVTGWLPIKSSFEKLQKLLPSGVKRYEIKDNMVYIYMDELSKNTLCLHFDMEQPEDLRVADPKPANVKVYDYYETDLFIVVPYEVRTTCGTKEELPFEPVYYRFGLAEPELVQQRLPPAPVKPMLELVDTEPVQIYAIGSQSVLWCQVSNAGATLNAKVTWSYPNGDLVTEGAGQRIYIIRPNILRADLHITEVQEEDAGAFVCSVTVNNVRQNKIVEIDVYEKISLMEGDRLQTASIHTAALIVCKMKGRLTPTISWQWNGKDIFYDGIHYLQVPDGLFIANITEADRGIYVCIGKVGSRFLSVEIEFSVVVPVEPPRAPESNPNRYDCPVCLTSNPENWNIEKRFCESKHAFKTRTGRTGLFRIKIKADLRPKVKKIIRLFLNERMSPHCNCPLLVNEAARTLILTGGQSVDKERELLLLDSKVTLIPLSSKLEKQVTRLAKKTCPVKNV